MTNLEGGERTEEVRERGRERTEDGGERTGQDRTGQERTGEEGGRAHFLNNSLLEQGDVWVHSGDIDVNLSGRENGTFAYICSGGGEKNCM